MNIESSTQDFVKALLDNDSLTASQFLDHNPGFNLAGSDTLLRSFIDLHMSSRSAGDVAMDSIMTCFAEDANPCDRVVFRRLSSSRFQAMYETTSDIAFLWESRSIDLKNPHFRVQRVMFKEADDDSHYWVQWHSSSEQAETEYSSSNSLNPSLASQLRLSLDETPPFSLSREPQATLQSLLFPAPFTSLPSGDTPDVSPYQGNGTSSDLAEGDDDDVYWSKYSEVDVY